MSASVGMCVCVVCVVGCPVCGVEYICLLHAPYERNGHEEGGYHGQGEYSDT